MHAGGFLHKLLSSVIHKSRAKALMEAVMATIEGGKLSLTSIGRAIDTGIQERSGIQKINRLLGNRHLAKERDVIFAAIAGWLINKVHEVGIIVDWTKFPNSGEAVLRAALMAEGRALTLYEERHPLKKMGNQKVHSLFLRRLKEIIPASCRPVLVTDAGFHNDWFRSVCEMGWEYVGRIRGMKKYRRPDEDEFIECSRLWKYADSQPRALGEAVITRKNPLNTNLYQVKGQLKGRKAMTKQGKIRQDKDSLGYSRSHREPWLLASSLTGGNAAAKVAGFYKRRMQIEEAFRDLKSSRYGFGLEEGKTRKAARRDILLLIAMLAGLVAWLVGKAGEKLGLHRQFQSNSVRNRRVLSFFYLGCRLIKKKLLALHVSIRSVASIINDMEYTYG